MAKTIAPKPEQSRAVSSVEAVGDGLEILILAPTGNDARLTADFLLKAGMSAQICRNIPDLCKRTMRGCGAIILAEETMDIGSISDLVQILDRQPPWSDIPVTVITSGSEASQMRLRRLAIFGPGGNVSLLERPFRPGTLISTVEVALRARRRQYAARDLMLELRASEERLRQYVSLMPTGMYTCDHEGRITFFNQRAAAMWGREPRLNDKVDQFCPCFKVFRPDGTIVPAAERAMARCLREGKSFRDVEAVVERPDGTRFTATFNLEAIRDLSGHIVGGICVFNDITERKRQQEALAKLSRQLQEQAQVFDVTLSHITDFAYTFDREGRFTYANKPLLDLWGLTLDQAVGRNFFELDYPPALATKLDRQIQQVFREKRSLRDETSYTSPSGFEGYYEYIFNPILAPDGSVEAVAGSTRIISERKRTEAAAESQRRVLQLMVEDAPLEDLLATLMRTMELESDTRIFGSVHLLDADGLHLRHGAAPSLPESYNQAIDGLRIGPAVGSCGTAAFSKQPVYVADIAADPLWADFKDLALRHDLRACWSLPILSTQGNVLGTFAMYHSEPRQPADQELRLMEKAARTASIAIERKLSDDAVRESEQRYSQLVHSLPAAVYTTDAQGRVSLFNEAAAVLWGRRPKIGSEFWCGSHKIFRPDGSALPLDDCPMAVTLKTGRPVRGVELVIERPDGTRRNVLPYPDPIHDASGKVIGAVNMLLDVTEIRRAEEASRRLAAIVESSEDAIISKDLNGIITSWNRGAERLFGYQAHEIIGRSVTVLMPPERSNEEPDILKRIRRGERIEHYETIRRRKDGTLIEIELAVSPIKDASGKIIGASKIVRDITNQKTAARELERAHQEVLASSRLKDDFLATLSHELRTPLNPVLLVAGDAANNPDLSPAIRADFRMIRKNVELEARLIDDLLDLTRISRGKLSLEKSLVDVHAVLHDAISIVRDELIQKQIILKLDLAAENHGVAGDPVRLQQVFWNILKNAVKFTPSGGRITVESRNATAGNEFTIAISDTGLGMTRSELARIFEAFTQGEHASGGGSHRFGGLGLGLAISRMLVEQHGGAIAADSCGRDQGSTFIITLPLVRASEGIAGEAKDNGITQSGYAGDNAATVHVLLVEDHEPTRTALAQLLTRRHYQVKSAGSIAQARILAGTHQFQLLISDIGLPDGSGLDLMQELRAGNKKIRGIALTGYGLAQDLERSQQAGFTHHLIKPVRVQSLEAALAAIPLRG